MIKAGVQVPDAMAVAAGGTNNLIYQEALEEAREAMLRGEGMAEPITATGLFPGGVCQMIRVGEDTGTLDDQLETAASFYGKEVEYKLDRLTALFEPLMILVVGLVVGFVAIALVSAMYGDLQPGEGEVTPRPPLADRAGEAGLHPHRGAGRARHPRRRGRRAHRRHRHVDRRVATCTARA